MKKSCIWNLKAKNRDSLHLLPKGTVIMRKVFLTVKAA